MRLTKQEIKIIKSNITNIFGETKIYLFGSRINNNKKGGDIDIYIIPKNRDNTFVKKLRAKTTIEDKLFKPIDIIVAKDFTKPIEKEALNGVVL